MSYFIIIKRQRAKRYVTLLQSPTKLHQTFNERTVRTFKSSYVKNHNFSPAYDRKSSFFCVKLSCLLVSATSE